MPIVCVIGAGLAGTELSYQLAANGVDVVLYEPRLSDKFSDGVHTTNKLAELVCSNSLRSDKLHNAAGLLKEELRRCKAILMSIADKHAVPSGTSLAVSREDFSEEATRVILSNSKITVVPQEVKNIEEMTKDFDAVAVATGPHTSKALSDGLKALIGQEYLYFYDAIAPLVDVESLDMNVCFRASRYAAQDDGGDYLNAPLSKEQYYKFVDDLIKGQKTPLHAGDEGIFFRGCMPIEVMAEDSPDTLLFGSMRGKGLINSHTSQVPYAAVQFRQDRAVGNIYNMVGFQTRLTYPEQERVFRTIPGLENVEFLRLGSMHRNTYVNAPRVLNGDMSLKRENRIFLAGQISGVEGYIESVAQSIIVARSILNRLDLPTGEAFPPYTAIGALHNYLINADPKNFQPMKINFGLFPPLSADDKKIFMLDKSKFENKLGLSKKSLAFLGYSGNK